MQVDVVTLQAEKSSTVELNEAVFGLEPRKDILHRMVTYQLAKRQAGTHKTKQRSEIAGTSKKFVKQKGSGGARHGNRKSNIFVGGGKAFGPVPRSHAIKLPKKVRALAMRHALSAKQGSGDLIVLNEAKLPSGKTAELVAALTKHQIGSALIVTENEGDENFSRAARNIPNLIVLPSRGANVYDILNRDKLVVTQGALRELEERLA